MEPLGARESDDAVGIEARLREMEARVQAHLERSFTERYERDRAFAISLIDRVGKIVAAVGGVLLIFFAFLGIKTYRDAANIVAQAAEARVNDLLRSNDPNSLLRTTADRILNRAVLNSYAVELAALRARNEHGSLQIAPADVGMLIGVMLDPTTPYHDFRASVDILTSYPRYPETPEAIHIRDRLFEVAAAEGTAAWVTRQPEKRAYALSAADPTSVRELALALVRGQADGSTKEVALKKLANYHDLGREEAAAAASLAAPNNVPSLRQNALALLARADPTNEALRTWVRSLTLPVNIHDAQLAVLVAHAAWTTPQRSGRTEATIDLAVQLLGRVVQSGAYFDKPLPVGVGLGRSQGPLSMYMDGRELPVPPQVVFASGARPSDRSLAEYVLQKSAAESMDMFRNSVAAFSLSRGNAGNYSNLRVILGPTTRMVLADGRVLDSETEMSDLTLVADAVGRDGRVTAYWFDERGQPTSAQFLRFEPHDAVTFSIEPRAVWAEEHRMLMTESYQLYR